MPITQRNQEKERRVTITQKRCCCLLKKSWEILSSIDKYILENAIKENADKCAVKTIRTHEKKLRNLTKNVTLPFRDTETVHNLSNVTLTTEELELLKYGLKHPIHPIQVNKTHILATFDFIQGAMTKDLRNEKQSGEARQKISDLVHSYESSQHCMLLKNIEF